MVIRQRAIQAQDKLERHDAILDAAEALLLRSPEHVASVADVARDARLAKGTVYLYFRSKDELLLAVHERGIDRYFCAVETLLAGPGPVSVDDMLALMWRHMVEPPLFLPMAARSFDVTSASVSDGSGVAFHRRTAVRLDHAGAALERHFTRLARGEGASLLRRSYALILGLWHISPALRTDSERAAMPSGAPASIHPREFDRALRALWHGSLGAPATR